ncbi:hypothetical protein KKD62_01395 [Patescibacteria group bacterium]|nr:hypothetical protein [Patescibacteria group bacterium]MBU1931662.1 hypothetical protein [Patescibacteria group bacterium]
MKNRSLLKLMILILIIFGVGQILVCSYLANKGQQLKEIEKTVLALEKENRVLVKDVAQVTSLSKLKIQASERGFVVNPEILDLSSLPVVALKP